MSTNLILFLDALASSSSVVIVVQSVKWKVQIFSKMFFSKLIENLHDEEAQIGPKWAMTNSLFALHGSVLWYVIKRIFTRLLLQKGSSLQEEILFVCP